MGLLDRLTFKQGSSAPPESITLGERGALAVTWPGGERVELAAAALRDACPCAGCVEEGTGRKLIDPATIPADIRPVELHGVGHYAIQITWSDGHSTGIYSWPVLRRACGLDG